MYSLGLFFILELILTCTLRAYNLIGKLYTRGGSQGTHRGQNCCNLRVSILKVSLQKFYMQNTILLLPDINRSWAAKKRCSSRLYLRLMFVINKQKNKTKKSLVGPNKKNISMAPTENSV